MSDPGTTRPAVAGGALRWLAATRPAFLSITLLAVVFGLSHAAWRSTLTAPDTAVLLLTLIGAWLAHAGANVLNDVADDDNGSDRANVDRVAPFTGGSRFIQLGLVSRSAMHRFGWSLLAASALCGFALLAATDWRLLIFGLGGLLLASAYSLPPLQLMSRGLGELAVILAWLLIVAGSDFIWRRQFDGAAWLAGLPLALQTGLILIANQIPDRAADLRAGKRNWIVRLDATQAVLPYIALLVAAYLAIVVACGLGALPAGSLIALAAAPIGIAASRRIQRYSTQPQHLASPIRLTLLQAHLVGALLTLGLFIDISFRTTP